MKLRVLLAISSLAMSGAGFADGQTPIVVTIENHVFQPTEIHIPSHQKAEILVKNLDDTAEEFESGALKIEKVIAAHGQGVVRIRPMDHGHYTFVGEYHEKTARGVLIAD